MDENDVYKSYKEGEDLFWEHPQHNTYQDGCSTCWSENMRIKEANQKALHNPYGSNYPLGFKPE